jgi:hypothetical protein
MSEALRALNDGLMDFDSVAGIEEPGQQPSDAPEPQQPEVQEPEGNEPEGQPEGQEPEGQPEPKEQPLSKHKQAKTKQAWEAREKARADKLKAELQAREQENAQMRQEFAKQQAEIAKFQREAKLNANPLMKRANELLEANYSIEAVEAEANRREAQGDQEGADISRAIAMHMRGLVEEAHQTKEAQQAQAAQTQWRNLSYGTPEFDQAVQSLKPGTQEFHDAWATVENNLVEWKAKSQDPWDQECAKQFSNQKSEFGQRLNHFLHNTDLGRHFKNNAEGMIPSFEWCKKDMILDHQAAAIRKLREENDRLRGHTSPSSGMPINGNSYRGNALPNKAENPDDYYKSFERLGLDEMKKVLRSRESV